MELRPTMLVEKHIESIHIIKDKLKEGITDAILYGSNNKDKYMYGEKVIYEEGFKLGTTIYAELMIKNNFFKEKREKR